MIGLNGIKPDNAKMILRTIAYNDGISRAGISKITRLSVMTVGKVADVLIDAGIVTEKKAQQSSMGRRTGMLSLEKNSEAVIIDLSERCFRLNIVNIGIGISDSTRYTYDKKFHYEENLYAFLKSARAYLDGRTDLTDPYGVGISVPGKYIISQDRVISSKVPELESVMLKSTVERIIGRSVTLITRNVEAAALSYVSQPDCSGGRVVLYIYIGECVDGAVYDHGAFVQGAHGFGCDFGRMRVRFGQTLDERIRACRNDLMIANELSDTVHNLIAIYDPDIFVIESDRIREPELFIDNIRNSLISVYELSPERIPVFLPGTRGVRQSAKGTAMMLREMWIDRIL